MSVSECFLGRRHDDKGGPWFSRPVSSRRGRGGRQGGVVTGPLSFDAVLFGKLRGLIMTRAGNWFYVDRGAHRKRVRGPDLSPECPVALAHGGPHRRHRFEGDQFQMWD
jgi:hypothetical protein